MSVGNHERSTSVNHIINEYACERATADLHQECDMCERATAELHPECVMCERANAEFYEENQAA